MEDSNAAKIVQKNGFFPQKEKWLFTLIPDNVLKEISVLRRLQAELAMKF
jgi:hypothetical protein